MRKARVEKRYRDNEYGHASTAVAGSNSRSLSKENNNPGAPRAVSGETLVKVLKALGELRQRAGISGVATIVGFVTCLHTHATSLISTLLAVAGFALMMILLQWFERWMKDAAT
jgi:predicted xylose isomerase-like sugar epimerase